MDRTYCSLLIVDDDANHRDIMTRRLEKEGYSVASADSGEKALNILEVEIFDLMLLDVTMPGMNGIDTLKQVRNIPQTKHMPVMMVTAISEKDTVIECIQAGANDYITKPFDMLVVKSRVWRCLEGGSYCEINPKDIIDSVIANILIVDDNDLNVDLLKRRVTKLGHQPFIAYNGEDALNLVNHNQIDLILLDIHMPGIDGIEVLCKLKADQKYKHIPVIMISANTENQIIGQCLTFGADDYITKPFNISLLNARMMPLIKIKKRSDSRLSKYKKLKALEELGGNIFRQSSQES